MPDAGAILDRLSALHPKVIDLSLGRIERLLAALDHPEGRLAPVIHIAGTNGKGSVLASLQAIFEAAGKSVHSYTSPHISRFNERIRLGTQSGGKFISDTELSKSLAICEAENHGAPITFFEITTAAAFLAFSAKPADYVLLETGLGGRLDATNMIDKPKLSIITPIDLDHQYYLGETIEQIAFEKAGILKPDVCAIIGPQSDRARAVIEKQADGVGAPLFISGQDWQAYEEHGRMIYQDEHGLLDMPLPKLVGRHQIDNAGIAIAAIRNLGDPDIAITHIEDGLESVDWPGRLERLGPGALFGWAPENCEIWVDGGHNPAAAQALATSMAEIEERVSKPLILIFGMLKNKDASAFLQAFKGLAARIITLKIPEEDNAYEAEDLAELAKGLDFAATSAPDLHHALANLKAEYPHAPRIMICGSLYLAGHVLDLHKSLGSRP